MSYKIKVSEIHNTRRIIVLKDELENSVMGQTYTKISEIQDTKKIIVLKDELGNIATGQTYNEALGYLKLRRKK